MRSHTLAAGPTDERMCVVPLHRGEMPLPHSAMMTINFTNRRHPMHLGRYDDGVLVADQVFP